MTMDLWSALWASGVGGVAGSERLGVRGHWAEGIGGGGGAQLQGSGLNLARAGRLINVTRVSPTGKDQLLDSFLTRLNQRGFNEEQRSCLNFSLFTRRNAAVLMASFGFDFHDSDGNE